MAKILGIKYLVTKIKLIMLKMSTKYSTYIVIEKIVFSENFKLTESTLIKNKSMIKE